MGTLQQCPLRLTPLTSVKRSPGLSGISLSSHVSPSSLFDCPAKSHLTQLLQHRTV